MRRIVSCTIVTMKLGKEGGVTTLVMNINKNWEWPERCDEAFYELNKIRHIFTILPDFLKIK